ncbi:hypothetical protein [Streptomyces sp. MMS20-AI2-20]|uniref:hypothetical protein n=1 Tax=Streptomyces sp. MMS20-AI2-20 TaxID=2925835 RepID=UPI001F60C561|nr:hypothetical protein [Streptomyces sp. MMS20-AI2-20]MCI4143563.1 hypothetical protein [Streptomyces sp. MMS20-AI2-20]
MAAPALALLAGTVLTLRLLPLPAARRTAGGPQPGAVGALAGWQLSRRPMRGAGPVLLLVLAVALGMLAVGQAPRGNARRRPGGLPGRHAGARPVQRHRGTGTRRRLRRRPRRPHGLPAFRTSVSLSGGRQATVLALDTEETAGHLLMRPDLADVPRTALSGLAPEGATAGVRIPVHRAARADRVAARPDAAATADVTATVEDAHGTPYLLVLGELPQDGRPHALAVDLVAVAGGPQDR